MIRGRTLAKIMPGPDGETVRLAAVQQMMDCELTQQRLLTLTGHAEASGQWGRFMRRNVVDFSRPRFLVAVNHVLMRRLLHEMPVGFGGREIRDRRDDISGPESRFAEYNLFN